MADRPHGLDLILCDDVVIEEATRRPTTIRHFHEIEASRFPTRRSFFALATIEHWAEGLPLGFDVRRNEDAEVIFQTERRTLLLHGQFSATLVFFVGSCVFTRPGLHQATLLLGRDWLAHRLFEVKRKEAGK